MRAEIYVEKKEGALEQEKKATRSDKIHGKSSTRAELAPVSFGNVSHSPRHANTLGRHSEGRSHIDGDKNENKAAEID